MATGGLYGSTSTGTVAPQSGSESIGLYGNNTVFGGTYFEWFVFQVSDTQPATPTGGSWNFTTNVGTPPSGWTVQPPINPTNTVWVSIGLVNSRSTATISWSTTGKFSFASGLPILSGTANPGAGDGQSDQLYIQTSTTPETIWFKQAGTWTRLTGSTLYMDTTSTQTIAGTKTFLSPISGSVSGTAANVTGIVAIANGGTGTTTANGAFNALAPSQTGNSGKYLTTDGSNSSWATNPLGTVTSVGGTGTVNGLTLTGTVTTSGNLTLGGTLSGIANSALTNSAITINGSSVSLGGSVTVTATASAALTIGTGLSGTSYNGSTAVTIANSGVLSVSGGTTGLTPSTATTGAVTLAGTLAVANGGTGVTTSTGSGSVVLNTGALLGSATVSDYETFTSVAAPTYTEGRLWYDSTQKALTYNNDISGNSLHVGQETQLKVRNGTGSTIAKGAPVYITSTATGVSFPNIALAKADTLTTGNCIGLTNEAIASGADGYVVINGILNGVNTGTFTVGDVLYVSPYSAGQLMNTFPPTGYPVKIGVVSFVNSSTGSIYINQSNAFVQASSVIGTLSIANGGTGQTTANAAFNALVPSQTSQSGKYLTTDGTNTSWATNPLGTVTSVGGTGTVNGLTLTGTVTTSGNLTLGGTLDLSSPPAIGGTAANTGRFSSITNTGLTSGRVVYSTTGGLETDSANLTFDGTNLTLLGGTANGVTYLNGSKVLTSGTALVFNGTTLTSPAFYSTQNIAASYNTQVLENTASNGYVQFQFNVGANGANGLASVSYAPGIFFAIGPASNDTTTPIVFRNNNGTERARIDSSGNVGIGTTSITAIYGKTLQLGSGGSENSVSLVGPTGSVFLATVGATGRLIARGGTDLQLGANDVIHVTLSTSGNVGIGTSSPAYKLDTNITITGAKLFRFGNSSISKYMYGYIDSGGTGITNSDPYTSGAMYYQNGSAHNWFTGSTQAMTLDSSGNLLVGIMSQLSTERLTIVATGTNQALYAKNAGGDFTFNCWNAAASGNNQFIQFITDASPTARGSITYNRGAGVVAYNVTSDYRAKDIFGSVVDSGILIDSTPVYMGKMHGATQERPMFLAHETPEYAHTGEKDAVDKDGKPVYQQMDASALIPVMWAEIQSLRKRLTALEST